MTKSTKEKLSLDELLEQALVKEQDIPYKVPKNWVWVRLIGGFAQCLDNYRKPVNSSERARREGNIPYYGATGQVGWINDFLTDEQLVLVGEDGAPFLDYIKDKAYLIQGKAWVNNHAHILRSLYGEYGNMYLMNYLNIFNYKGYVNGTTRLKLTQSSMNDIPIPLPPLAEQQRIVKAIDSLFEKMDIAKELMQNALDSFESRKTSILHKAFTGELTAKWRKENGINLDSWRQKKISEICSVVRGGSPRPAGDEKYYNGKIPFLKVADITRNEGAYIYDYECSIKETGLKKTRMVDANTLLLTNSGATLGVPAICTFKTTFNDGIAAFLNLDIRSIKFFYYFWTVKTQTLRTINKGAAQPNLNTEIIGNIKINLPSIEEQQEIVRILDNILSKEQQSKELCDVIEKIDLMKKAILAKAFRGELGTNNPHEESALNLLKQILKEKN